MQHFAEFKIWYQFAAYGLIAVGWALAVLYFNISGSVNLFRRWISSERYVYLVEALKAFHNELLMRLLFLSFLRYLVFVIQYILIFYLFGVNVSAEIIFCVMSVVFLTMAIIPSIALLEVGLRGEISILLMGMFSANTLGIGFTSITLWLINLIVPAVAGSLLILNLRAFKKRW